MNFMYDFDTKSVANPFDGVTRFVNRNSMVSVTATADEVIPIQLFGSSEWFISYPVEKLRIALCEFTSPTTGYFRRKSGRIHFSIQPHETYGKVIYLCKDY